MKCIFRLLWLCILCSGSIYAQSDCPDAIVVCGNDDYYGLDATGVGVQELGSNACFSQEHNSLWLKIMIKEGGTLGFTITPEEIDDLVVDFDFWIFGPNVECDNLGTAIRCSTTNPLAAGLDYNTTGMNDTETDTSEGLGSDGNSFIQWMEVEDGDIYYLIIDRPHGSSNFSLEWNGSATFHDIPVFNNPDNIPLDITQCDNDGAPDGHFEFDLTVYADMFIGSQTGVALTYHLSENDMVTGDNPIENPESFINGALSQTIYMKMTDVVTGCYSNEIYTITVTPGIGEPQNLALCAEEGYAEFNLDDNFDLLANGSGNAQITYYTNQQDAEGGINDIGPLYENQQPYQTETIWARLDKPDEGCVAFKQFTITPLPEPVFETPGNQPPDLTLCDNDGAADESVIFDLTVNETAIKGSQQNISISYYEDMEGIPAPLPIASPEAYENPQNPQIIHIVLINTLTGCSTIKTFTLNVTPGAGNPNDLYLCDDDGIVAFNLSQNNNAITSGNPDATVSYYRTIADAQNQEDEIGPMYENQTAYTIETVWARMDRLTEGCTDYVSFTLNPVTPPYFEVLDDNLPEVITCDNDGTDDGLAVFNLTVNETQLAGSQQNVAFTYYEDNNGVPGAEILDPEVFYNSQSPQQLHVMISDTVTGCTAMNSFLVIVLPGAGNPQDLTKCSADGIATFDLSVNNLLTANGNTDAVITYHLNEDDALGGINSIGTTYTNTQAYQQEIIWARSTVADGNCGDVASFNINVIAPPVLNNPNNVELDLSQCDSDAVDDESTAFNLTQFEVMFTGDQENIAITYHTSANDAQTGDAPIPNPQSYNNISNPQTVYVRMESTIADCYVTTPFTLNIDYTLPVGEPEDILLCDTERNGYQLFNLSLNNNLIKNGNANTQVNYYASQQDAVNETNPLQPFYVNTTPYFTQQIWARLENITGCYGYGLASFNIGIFAIPDTEYTFEVIDFTDRDNEITVNINNYPELFEYSIDGVNYTSSNNFTNLEAGLYTVYVRSLDNCAEFTIEVPVLNYPRYFTPNGDGTHEVWNVNYIRYYPDARITIFDRYGKLIKSYQGKEPGWEGTYNGENLPATDYWFLLEFATGRKINGHFSLIR